jgi:formylglycine-generating enzyme required for sulfatase activity
MGHDEPSGGPPPAAGYPDFIPPHQVTLPPFFVDIFSVTNAQYKACFDASACPNDCMALHQCTNGDGYSIANPAFASFPVLTAENAGAEAYCQWVGKRLPTEAEWERAARGPQDYDYPWGNDLPDCTRVRCDVLNQYYSFPVGSIPGDVSPEGVREMVSNGQDVLHDAYDEWYYYNSPQADPQGPPQTDPLASFRVLRGNIQDSRFNNSFGYSAPVLPAWVRFNGWGGIRCARSDLPNMASPRTSEQFVRLRQRLSSGRPVPRGGSR